MTYDISTGCDNVEQDTVFVWLEDNVKHLNVSKYWRQYRSFVKDKRK